MYRSFLVLSRIARSKAPSTEVIQTLRLYFGVFMLVDLMHVSCMTSATYAAEEGAAFMYGVRLGTSVLEAVFLEHPPPWYAAYSS